MGKLVIVISLLFMANYSFSQYEDLKSSAKEGYVNNNGVNIHYLSWGKGPLIVMLHGFPDFWYSWRYLIPEFSKDYTVVVMDLRGYNLSDKPEGVDSYRFKELRSDLIAIIDHFGFKKATLIANDWGGAIAWNTAIYAPDRVERLVACNIPHPRGIQKFLGSNPQTGQYARNYQAGKGDKLTPEDLVKNIPEPDQRKYYLEAFRRSSIESMLNYYKASYPRTSSSQSGNSKTSTPTTPKSEVKCPVLMIHGLKDTALPPGMLNDTWDYIEKNLTIFTIPDGGHFIQQEKPKEVIAAIRAWFGLMDNLEPLSK